MKHLLWAILCLCTFVSYSQDNSNSFTHPSFPDYKAYFDQKDPSKIFLAVKNKPRELPFYGKADTSYYKTICANKKLKLSGMDILFLQEAAPYIAFKQLLNNAMQTTDGYKTKLPELMAAIGMAWRGKKTIENSEITETGLGILTLKKGTGALPEKGKDVKVHYAGYLENGAKFDSSYDRNKPFMFKLGTGSVIKGWDEGIAKLPAGTVAILKIPADLGYGARGQGPIPANATLYFLVEIIGQ